MGTFDQSDDLNKKDSTQSVEACDEIATAENGSLNCIDAHEIEKEETSEQLSSENFHDFIEPEIGMEFRSVEDARKLYEIYGSRTGFTIRNNHKRRSRTDQKIIGQEFVCLKEASRAKNPKLKKSGPHSKLEIMRGKCNARLVVSLRDQGKWIVTKFVKEHNHVLASPEKIHLQKPVNKLNNEDTGMLTSDQRDLYNKDLSQLGEECEDLAKAENGSIDVVNMRRIEKEIAEELSIENSPTSSGLIEPEIGMEFKSVEYAKKFYENYGSSTGFTVCNNHKRRSRTDQKVIGQEFVCLEGGSRAKKLKCEKSGRLSKPATMRGKCNAMLIVSLRDEGKWIVTKFVKEHNHVLASPQKVFMQKPVNELRIKDTEMTTSDQSGDLPNNDISELGKACEELATAENGSIDIANTCRIENEETEELSIKNLPISSGLIEPEIGMEFNSVEDAKGFYQIYGSHTGFTVRSNRKRRSRKDKTIIGQEFVCSKEGLRAKKPKFKKSMGGCNAMLVVSLRDGGNWVVTKFIKEHNHGLECPENVSLRTPVPELHNEGEKGKEIQELCDGLRSERQRCERCAVYQEQLNVALKIIENAQDTYQKMLKIL